MSACGRLALSVGDHPLGPAALAVPSSPRPPRRLCSCSGAAATFTVSSTRWGFCPQRRARPIFISERGNPNALLSERSRRDSVSDPATPSLSRRIGIETCPGLHHRQRLAQPPASYPELHARRHLG